MSAVISDCGTYRYALERDTGVLGGEGTVLFVMLNPSTADAEQDDPTVRRCLGFARDWGYSKLSIANLFAFRSSSPRNLADIADPVGPDNEGWITRLAAAAGVRVAAWGEYTPGIAALSMVRAREAFSILEHGGGGWVRCLGLTSGGRPRHPLYVPAATALERFEVAA